MPYLEGTAENDWGKRMFDRLRIVEDKLDQLLVMQEQSGCIIYFDYLCTKEDYGKNRY